MGNFSIKNCKKGSMLNYLSKEANIYDINLHKGKDTHRTMLQFGKMRTKKDVWK